MLSFGLRVAAVCFMCIVGNRCAVGSPSELYVPLQKDLNYLHELYRLTLPDNLPASFTDDCANLRTIRRYDCVKNSSLEYIRNVMCRTFPSFNNNTRQPCGDVIDVLCLLADIRNDVLNVVFNPQYVSDYNGLPNYQSYSDVSSWLSSTFFQLPTINNK